MEYMQMMPIVPKSRGTDDKPSESFSKQPAGTGFYKIIKWERDKPIELEAWKSFRDGVMRPRYLTVKYIPDPTTRLAALMAGEVDLITGPAAAHLKLIRAHKDLALATLKGGRMIFYACQFLKPPFNDPRVRQALLYAVDRQAIVDKILEGNGIIIPSFLYGPWEGAIPDLKPYPYDPKKAKELLTEAGYPNGFEMMLRCSSGFNIKDKEIAEALQKYLSEIGVKMRIETAERARLFQIFYTGDFDLLQGQWSLSAYTPDPPLKWVMVRGFPEDKISGGVVPKDIAQIRDLIKKAGTELDKKKRVATYQQINKIMYENAVPYAFHAEDINTAYNKTKIGPWERVVFLGYGDFELFCDFRGMYPVKYKQGP
jgi:peptide/nickel transport system substrate-binding protein